MSARLLGAALVAGLTVPFSGLARSTFAQTPDAAQTPGAHSTPPAATRSVIYHTRDLVALHARVRYTTLIVLPDGEQVVEATCGDRDHWIVNVRDGLVSVKPTQPGVASNLNVVSTSGGVYTFLVSEQSGLSDGDAVDLTVYLERDDTSPLHRKFVSADGLEDFRQQAELAREEASKARDDVRAELDAGLTAFRTTYPLAMRFPYQFSNRKKPFRILAMWHDDHRTFVQTTARELPALYELQDNLAALVNFDVRDNTYVVPKVLGDGYFQVGRVQVPFRTEEGK
jgi:type IV secretion system protein VirB9